MILWHDACGVDFAGCTFRSERMLKELYTAALGMLPQQMRLEITANNIANANTIGFKRSGIFEQSLIEARENLFNVRGDAETEDTPISQYIDFRQGALQKTGNSLDLAPAQGQFFVIADRDGSEYLSQAGHFTLDPQGFIITADGKLLLGTGGPLRIDLPQQGDMQQADTLMRTVQVSPQGEITVNGLFVGQLRIVEVTNPQTLQRSGASSFTATDQTILRELPPTDVRIQQGYLEMSNVDIVRELVTMIQLQRMFELGQKVIQTNDSTLDRSIDIGRFIS